MNAPAEQATWAATETRLLSAWHATGRTADPAEPPLRHGSPPPVATPHPGGPR
ncbi:hypothetical protein [Streptomyces sp. CdTB01]|uniref:hypothetical protein n=1 Tax=Streptomyces sp. CdTB01 TaxID=1725411 RepID=UPI000AFE2542|nr:hypothetical protein [Streptomyces sp. CdTB01]